MASFYIESYRYSFPESARSYRFNRILHCRKRKRRHWKSQNWRAVWILRMIRAMIKYFERPTVERIEENSNDVSTRENTRGSFLSGTYRIELWVNYPSIIEQRTSKAEWVRKFPNFGMAAALWRHMVIKADIDPWLVYVSRCLYDNVNKYK